MKRYLKIAAYILTAAVCSALFIDTSRLHYEWGTQELLTTCEFLFYGSLGIWLLLTFVFFAKKLSTVKKKLFLACPFSLLYTVLVFLSNNFFRFLLTNTCFGWKFVISYPLFLKWDITYVRGMGAFRYPLVFLLMLLLCVLVTVFSIPKVKKTVFRFLDRAVTWAYYRLFYIETLKGLYVEYTEGTSLTRLEACVSLMPLNGRNKRKLMHYAEITEDYYVVYLFISRYESMLTKEEYLKYKKKFMSLAEDFIKRQREYYSRPKIEYPDVLVRLDERFGETEKGEASC